MDIYQLRLVSTVAPKWLDVEHSGRLAVHDNQVTLDGERLEIICCLQQSGGAEAPKLATGAWLEVWQLSSGVFVGAKAEDVDDARAAKSAREEAVQDARRENEERLLNQARAFNASLQIPARWVPGVIADASGNHSRVTAHDLDECDIHVLLKQAMHDGRLIRKPADLLCRRSVGSGGGHRLKVTAMEGAKVTCKECLALAKRWRSDYAN